MRPPITAADKEEFRQSSQKYCMVAQEVVRKTEKSPRKMNGTFGRRKG